MKCVFCQLLMLDFLTGMHYLHAEAPVKVIHRDLKSRNGNTWKTITTFLKHICTQVLFAICLHCVTISYPATLTGFLSFTVVMTADRVLKVCVLPCTHHHKSGTRLFLCFSSLRCVVTSDL